MPVSRRILSRLPGALHPLVSGIGFDIVVVISASVFAGVWFARLWRLTSGDAAIAWVYAKNLAEHGAVLTFNPGEPSSGASSPGFVAALAAVHLTVGSGPEFLYYDLATFAACLISIAAFWVLVRRRLNAPSWVAVAALALFLANVPQVYYSAVAFETPAWLASLLLMWIGLLRLLSADPERWRCGLGFAVFGAAQTILRPEGAFLAVGAGLCVALQRALRHGLRQSWQSAACFTAVAVSPAVALAAFNLVTGGRAMGASTAARLELMRHATEALPASTFLHSLWASNGGWLALVGVVGVGAFLVTVLEAHREGQLRAWTSSPRAIFALYLLGIVALTTVVYSTRFRVLVTDRYATTAPVALLVLAVAALPAAPAWRRRGRAATAVAAALCLLISASSLRHASATYSTLERMVPLVTPAEMLDDELVSWFEANTPRSASVLMYEVQVRYALDRTILDLDGVITGRSAPYFLGDWAAYLCRYRPDYWVSNDALFRRRDMITDDAVFVRARSALEGRPVSSQVTVDGVTFRLEQRRGVAHRSQYSTHDSVYLLTYEGCEGR